MKKTEFYTGLFLLFGLFCFSYVALSLGGMRVFGDSRYTLKAEFTSISGLKSGAIVEIAGVQIGNVTDISLNGSRAVVTFKIEPQVKIATDSIAAIRTRGLIGEKFVKITPGGDSTTLAKNQSISETESVVDLEEMIGKFIYDKK